MRLVAHLLVCCAATVAAGFGLSSPSTASSYTTKSTTFRTAETHGVGLGTKTGGGLKPVHAYNGRYTVNQVRHVFTEISFTCKRSPTFFRLVILGCRTSGSPIGLSAFITNPHFRGAILYGLPNRVPGTRYTQRRNVTLIYRPAARPLAQIALSLLR